MSLCPECDTPIHVSGEVEIGKVILCPDCQVPLTVIHREPMELTLVPELIEGDWAD
jgi:lysine biosynthesis protein LysW